LTLHPEIGLRLPPSNSSCHAVPADLEAMIASAKAVMGLTPLWCNLG
jgi:hypothetical protein